MKIHLIAGLLGSGRQRVYIRLIESLDSLPDTEVIHEFVGAIVGSTESSCLSEINNIVQAYPTADHIVLTGDGLSKYIQPILAAYPDAALYLVQRTDPALELRQKTLDAILTLQQVGAETAQAYNLEVRPILEATASSLGMTWKMLGESVFEAGNVPSYAAAGESSTTEIAVRNL